jgi:hypothetical protein
MYHPGTLNLLFRCAIRTNFAVAFGMSNWPVPAPFAEIFKACCSLCSWEKFMTSCVKRGAIRGLGAEILAGLRLEQSERVEIGIKLRLYRPWDLLLSGRGLGSSVVYYSSLVSVSWQIWRPLGWQTPSHVSKAFVRCLVYYPLLSAAQSILSPFFIVAQENER